MHHYYTHSHLSKSNRLILVSHRVKNRKNGYIKPFLHNIPYTWSFIKPDITKIETFVYNIIRWFRPISNYIVFLILISR